ncbi:winged helix DNA-binding protein [Pseudalkalibacillus caeni]|uniref:MarR family transcriptional regulator n=1 Tax=Exobacillus caeni TaxID=2574798 RepID=A0A5R9F9M0_9BACL|nr:winged helix DNA-binding protein [Pseudalkalibacillus caeni]TLS36405.1 MarR family transcriptional regulator [Pseudalkalibacillus caeni]
MGYSKEHIYMNYIRGAYKVLESDWQKHAREIGLTQAEQHVLWIASIEKEATITRISEVGLWDVSTVMQVLKRLKDKGLIEMHKKESDRRISYVTLTDQGWEKKEASKAFSYKIFDYIHDFVNESEENEQLFQCVVKFTRELNRHFYGNDFTHWVEKDSKVTK